MITVTLLSIMGAQTCVPNLCSLPSAFFARLSFLRLLLPALKMTEPHRNQQLTSIENNYEPDICRFHDICRFQQSLLGVAGAAGQRGGGPIVLPSPISASKSFFRWSSLPAETFFAHLTMRLIIFFGSHLIWVTGCLHHAKAGSASEQIIDTSRGIPMPLLARCCCMAI